MATAIVRVGKATLSVNGHTVMETEPVEIDLLAHSRQQVSKIYTDISKVLDTPGAFHRCHECGFQMDHWEGDGGKYTANGWPKHCNKTMEFVQPSLLRWERGYRVHGYLTGSSKRVGHVGLSSNAFGPVIYSWECNGQSGEAKTLRTAKRRVERAYLARKG